MLSLTMLVCSLGLLVQGVVPGTGLVAGVANTILALVLPAVGTWGAMEVSKVVPLIDHLADWEKRVVVAIEGVLLNGVAHALHLTLPAELGGIDPATAQLIVSTGLAFVLHRLIRGPSTPAPAATT